MLGSLYGLSKGAFGHVGTGDFPVLRCKVALPDMFLIISEVVAVY